MSARQIYRIHALTITAVALVLLSVSAALADDRRSDPTNLGIMTINTYFMWDGVEPEEGSDQIDIPWRQSQQEAEEHTATIAEVIARANPDIVNLVEIENEAALTTLSDRFLALAALDWVGTLTPQGSSGESLRVQNICIGRLLVTVPRQGVTRQMAQVECPEETCRCPYGGCAKECC